MQIPKKPFQTLRYLHTYTDPRWGPPRDTLAIDLGPGGAIEKSSRTWNQVTTQPSISHGIWRKKTCYNLLFPLASFCVRGHGYPGSIYRIPGSIYRIPSVITYNLYITMVVLELLEFRCQRDGMPVFCQKFASRFLCEITMSKITK